MKLLELFAGSRSISNQAEMLGIQTFTVDINSFDGIDYVMDILRLDVKDLPQDIDFLWASPPCTAFSVASIGHHWTGVKVRISLRPIKQC